MRTPLLPAIMHWNLASMFKGPSIGHVTPQLIEENKKHILATSRAIESLAQIPGAFAYRSELPPGIKKFAATTYAAAKHCGCTTRRAAL
jgi:hypothetical protein